VRQFGVGISEKSGGAFEGTQSHVHILNVKAGFFEARVIE